MHFARLDSDRKFFPDKKNKKHVKFNVDSILVNYSNFISKQ